MAGNQRFGTVHARDLAEMFDARDILAGQALSAPAKELLKNAMADLNLSARAYGWILKVARTIADLAGSEKILSDHVSEAIQYRSLDRQIWSWMGALLPARPG